MPIAYNPRTGKALMLQGEEWVDAPIARNKETGAVAAFDGNEWTPVSMDEKEAGIGETVLDQTAQGMSLGYSDELFDAAGAGIIAASDKDLDFKDAYKMARDESQKRLRLEMDDRPALSIASNVAGGLATGGLAASTKAGTAVGNSLRSGDLAARVGKGLMAGATTGAVAGAGTADDGSRGQGAIEGGLLGGAIGAAAPLVGAAVKRAVSRTVIPNADKLREAASEAYSAAEAKGGILKPQFTDKFVDEISQLKPQTDIGKVVGGDSAFTKLVEKIEGIRGKPITLDAAQEFDELLGEAVDSYTDMGRVNKQGQKILNIQSKFRNMIMEASPDDLVAGDGEGFELLKKGRELWSTSRKLSDIERIIANAELTDNPATSIKSGFRTLLNNPNRVKAFNKKEREAIKAAAESGFVQDTLRVFGSRIIPMLSFAKGGLGAGAVANAASAASRGAASRVQVSKADRLANLVAESGANRAGIQTQFPTLLTRGATKAVSAVKNPLFELMSRK